MEDRIYYLLDPVASEIKIGITCDVELRQQVLSNERGVGLHLMASHRGTINDERRSHSACSAHRVSGEWFRDCDMVRNHMRGQLERRASDSLKQVQKLIDALEEHGDRESADWQDDMIAAIREEMTEYLRLLDFCNCGQSRVAA